MAPHFITGRVVPSENAQEGRAVYECSTCGSTLYSASEVLAHLACARPGCPSGEPAGLSGLCRACEEEARTLGDED